MKKQVTYEEKKTIVENYVKSIIAQEVKIIKESKQTKKDSLIESIIKQELKKVNGPLGQALMDPTPSIKNIPPYNKSDAEAILEKVYILSFEFFIIDSILTVDPHQKTF